MSDTITIFASATNEELLDGRARAREVSLETIKRNLQEFVSSLDELIPDLKPRPEGFRLKSFEVAVGVDGKGQVGFLGTGTEVGANATLTLSFERE